MKMKILVIACLIFIILSIIPIVNSENTNNQNISGVRDINLFTTCFIEADGEIAYDFDWPAIIKMPNMWKTLWFRPFNNDKALVTSWMLVFNYDSDVKIYNRENGDLLWNHQGTEYPQLKIFGFYGDYIPSSGDDDSFRVSLSGRAFIVLSILRE